MTLPHVSIIMSVTNRWGNLHNTLRAWSHYCRTAPDVYCLHQHHDPSTLTREDGYHYFTVEQARLLEDAPRGN